MSLDMTRLIDKSPKQLSELKLLLLSKFNFTDAEIVADYIKHCISTSRMVKEILNNDRGQNLLK